MFYCTKHHKYESPHLYVMSTVVEYVFKHSFWHQSAKHASSPYNKQIILTTVTSVQHLTLPATPATSLFCHSQSSQTSASLCLWTQRAILIPSSVYFSAVFACSLYIPPSFRLAGRRYRFNKPGKNECLGSSCNDITQPRVTCTTAAQMTWTSDVLWNVKKKKEISNEVYIAIF